MDIVLKLGREKLLEMYRKMVKIRKFEMKVEQLHLQGVLPGLKHLYMGEEAVAVGVISNLKEDDYIASTHRGHGHLIAKGGDIRKMMAELYGKKTGYCKGKGGSMHISDINIGILGANGIVGANIPIAGGAALSIKFRGTCQVAVSFFGDGGANEGIFHEGINLASVWKLPVIFVCENNLYAISTHQPMVTAIPDIGDRATSYGIPKFIVDGMDVLAVYEAAGEAITRAREGKGPSLIECKTYRFRGHYVGEGSRELTYRSQEELENWEERCPIKRFQSKLMKKNILTPSLVNQINHQIDREIEEAVEFAEQSPYPEPQEALDDLFSRNPER
jgi:pyruvate dehydrogenase E1 component alpha subunit